MTKSLQKPPQIPLYRQTTRIPCVASEDRKGLPGLVYLFLAALVMAYGWGYRGTVGHEAGAMVPGALLGLVLCLGSGRFDWYRRSAVAGLFGAIGWAWGGSLSYMEHTLYALSDSFVDVLYGYTMLFFLGALWAGIGGGVLGLALTEPRSQLERLTRPFTVICAVFFAAYLFFRLMPEYAEAFETLTVRSFHDGDWLAATLTLVVSGTYWLSRPKDRSATALFFCGAVAWWVGYLAFTKFGGLRLAPLHRSESWGGVVGILVVLMVYLIRRHNRAALMLCLYGVLGGGMAFAFAVFIRHPLVVHWGPFAANGPFKGPWPQWRFAEDSFGFLMGLAIALGARRLIRGDLVPPREDTPRAPLDVYAVFVMLVALIWVNFRRHAAPWLAKSDASGVAPSLGIPLWAWYVFAAALATTPILYVLKRCLRGDRQLVPQSAFGKGAMVTLMLIWTTVAGYAFHDAPNAQNVVGHLLLWIPAAFASWLLLSYTPSAPYAFMPSETGVMPSDPKWKVGRRYVLNWALAPVLLLCFTGLSMSMQDGPLEGMGRNRFGPDAYWRQTARLIGMWKAAGTARALSDAEVRADDIPVTRLEFDQNRNVAATMASGEVVTAHQWFLKNQYTWLRWYGKDDRHPERVEIPLEFRDQRLYVPWPPGRQGESYIVFERVEK